VLHRTRYLLIRQQTSVINAIRAHLAEFGITAPVGRRGFEELLRVVADPSDKRVPHSLAVCGGEWVMATVKLSSVNGKVFLWCSFLTSLFRHLRHPFIFLCTQQEGLPGCVILH
jgi:hypothetical protein